MKVNSYKIKSEEDLQRNVSTTPSFQKLQEKILNIQQKNDIQDQILPQFSQSCNTRTFQNSADTIQYSCRDNLIHSEYNSISHLDSSQYKKTQFGQKDQYSNSIHQASPISQKLYDPPKQDQHQQTLKPPRYHTPTRDSIKSHDLAAQKQKTLTKTDSKKSQKTNNQTTQKSNNNSNSKCENSSKNNQIYPETSPMHRKGSHSSQSKVNKIKIEDSNKKSKEGVTEKDKKIIEKIQKKLQNKSPLSKNLKENNRSNTKQINEKQQIGSTIQLSQEQRIAHYENLLQRTPTHYGDIYDAKDSAAYLKSKEEESEANIQQNFLSNLKEKLNQENQLINEQLQKLDQKMIPTSYQDTQKTTQQSLLNLSAKSQNIITHYNSSLTLQSQAQNLNNLQQFDQFSASNQYKKNSVLSTMNSTLRKPSTEINKEYQSQNGCYPEQINNNFQSIQQNSQSSTIQLRENKVMQNLSNSSSSESINDKQKLMKQEQIKNYQQKILEDLSKSPVAAAGDTRATSCKSRKNISNPLSYEKDLNNRFSTEDKSQDYGNTTDEELFSSYSLASKSNKNINMVKNPHLQASNFDNVLHLYQPGEYQIKSSNNQNKENIFLEQKRLSTTDRGESHRLDQNALCSTFRQCVNGNLEQINDFKNQIKQLQNENQQLKSLVQKQENQTFLNKKLINESKVQIQKMENQNQQLVMKNKQLSDKILKYEELMSIQKTESVQSQKDISNKFQDKINQLQCALNSKQAEADQLRVDLSKIQQTVEQQIEKTNSQQIKIKNLEQLVSEYSKIESKLFELEDIHESVKNHNEALQQQIEQNLLFEQKLYTIILEIKKCQQIQKGKVLEFSQVIEAYLKLTECIITGKEPSVDVLVGHRRKRSSFLEIKKQEDIQNLVTQLESENFKKKINEQYEIVLAYIKGSSDKVQIVLDQSRSLLDKLSDYYMQKFGNGII